MLFLKVVLQQIVQLNIAVAIVVNLRQQKAQFSRPAEGEGNDAVEQCSSALQYFLQGSLHDEDGVHYVKLLKLIGNFQDDFDYLQSQLQFPHFHQSDQVNFIELQF